MQQSRISRELFRTAGAIFTATLILPLSLGAYNELLGRSFDTEFGDLLLTGEMILQFIFVLAEVTILFALFAKARRLTTKPFRIFAETCLVVPYAFTVAISWRSMHLHGIFADVHALTYLLNADYKLYFHLSTVEYRQGLYTLLLAIAGSVFLYYRFREALRECPSDTDIPKLSRSTIAIVGLTALLVFIPGLFGNRNLRNILSPEIALLTNLSRIATLWDNTSVPWVYNPMPTVSEWGAAVQHGSSQSRPDIFIVLIESLRSDVLYGTHFGPMVAPHLHELSAQSVNFINFRASAPESRYAIEATLSGIYPYQSILRHQNYDRAAQQFPILSDFLSTVGYSTGDFSACDETAATRFVRRPSFGIHQNMVARQAPKDRTVFRYMQRDGMEPEDITALISSPLIDLNEWDIQNALDFDTWLSKEPTDHPLFGVITLSSSHFPWHVRNQEDRIVPTDDDSVARSVSSLRLQDDYNEVQLQRYYRNSVHQVDRALGKILQSIQGRRKDARSILFVLGDHGSALGEHNFASHGTSLYDGQLKVPLLVKFSDRSSQSINKSPGSQVDIAPTILDLLELPPFPGHQGKPLFSPSERGNAPDFFTLQVIRSMIGVLDWPYKGIMNLSSGEMEVFNLADDPKEVIDLSAKEPTISKRLRQRLESFEIQQLSYHRIPFTNRERLAPPRHDN